MDNSIENKNDDSVTIKREDNIHENSMSAISSANNKINTTNNNTTTLNPNSISNLINNNNNNNNNNHSTTTTNATSMATTNTTATTSNAIHGNHHRDHYVFQSLTPDVIGSYYPRVGYHISHSNNNTIFDIITTASTTTSSTTDSSSSTTSTNSNSNSNYTTIDNTINNTPYKEYYNTNTDNITYTIVCPLATQSYRDGLHSCHPIVGKQSITKFRPIWYNQEDDTTLVECQLFSGRTHQSKTFVII